MLAAGGRRGLHISWRLIYPRGHKRWRAAGAEDPVATAVEDAMQNFIERHKIVWVKSGDGTLQLLDRL